MYDKERLREQKEVDSVHSEVKLSDDRQAKVNDRKKELEAILAGMQKLESEFDDLDDDFDDELGLLLKPEELADLTRQAERNVANRKMVFEDDDDDDV